MEVKVNILNEYGVVIIQCYKWEINSFRNVLKRKVAQLELERRSIYVAQSGTSYFVLFYLRLPCVLSGAAKLGLLNCSIY